MTDVRNSCEFCKEGFLVSTAELSRGFGRFCSRSCAAKWGNANRPKRGRRKLSYAERKKIYGKNFMIGQLVGRLQGRAREKGVPCELTSIFFRDMWTQQEGRCYYTGRKMSMGGNSRNKFEMDQVSVDRIEPDKGYVKGNMVLCCRWVNVAKGQGSLEGLKVRAAELFD